MASIQWFTSFDLLRIEFFLLIALISSNECQLGDGKIRFGLIFLLFSKKFKKKLKIFKLMQIVTQNDFMKI